MCTKSIKQIAAAEELLSFLLSNMKPFILSVIAACLLIRCSSTTEKVSSEFIDGMDAYLENSYNGIKDVFINTTFAYTVYKQSGTWPNRYQDSMKSVPDSIRQGRTDSALYHDYLFFIAHEDTIHLNWNLMRRMRFKINNDSILQVKISEFDDPKIQGEVKFLFPLAELESMETYNKTNAPDSLNR